MVIDFKSRSSGETISFKSLTNIAEDVSLMICYCSSSRQIGVFIVQAILRYLKHGQPSSERDIFSTLRQTEKLQEVEVLTLRSLYILE